MKRIPVAHLEVAHRQNWFSKYIQANTQLLLSFSSLEVSVSVDDHLVTAAEFGIVRQVLPLQVLRKFEMPKCRRFCRPYTSGFGNRFFLESEASGLVPGLFPPSSPPSSGGQQFLGGRRSDRSVAHCNCKLGILQFYDFMVAPKTSLQLFFQEATAPTCEDEAVDDVD